MLLHVHTMKVIICHLQNKIVSANLAKQPPNSMSRLKTIAGIIPLNHIGRCIKINFWSFIQQQK